MIIFAALTQKARYTFILVLFAAFALNSFASTGPDPAQKRLLFEISGGEHLPKWFPKNSAGIMEEALRLSVFERETKSENESKSYGELIGHFSKFYILHADEYREVCYKALSLGACRELLWSKTEEVIAKSIHLTVESAVNELLFLKNNPHLEELRIPLEKTHESLGLKKGKGLAGFLNSFQFELNPGGFKTTLINDNDNYRALAGLMGRVTPKEMTDLLLRAEERTPLKMKLKMAREVFNLEWKLFVNNVLFPQTVLTSLEKAGEKAFFMTPKEVRPKISSMALGICESAPERILNSPEVGVFCRYLHQSS